MTFTLDTSGAEWRPISGFPGYEVSDGGRVRSLPRVVIRHGRPAHIAGGVLRPRTNPKGYLYVNLYREGRQHVGSIHRLVAQAFVPNPEGKPEVNHDDTDKTNNRATNLVWATRNENQAHAAANLRIRCKLNAEQIGEIRRAWPALRAGEKTAFAAKFGIGPRQLWKIGTGRAHRHLEIAA